MRAASARDWIIRAFDLRKAAIAAGLTCATLFVGAPTASAGPFCAVGSLNYGHPDCTYWTWQQCRIAVAGVGDYCEINRQGPYVFDLRDPANPKVVQDGRSRQRR
jgi:hypothetical protein